MKNVDSIINDAFKHFADEDYPNFSELFEERLNRLGISRHQAEQVLGLDKKTLNPILDHTAKSIDTFNLLKLGEFLGVADVQKLINIYMSKADTQRVIELEKVKKACYIIENFSVELLKKEGFIKGSINDFDEIEKRIVQFFELRSIYDYSEKLYQPLFSRTKKSTNNKMLDFWVKSAYYMFQKKANPNAFDRDFLKDLISKIKPFSRDVDNGIVKVIRALYKAGVTVICQPHLSTTQIRGATFIIDDKPCIVITNLNDRYPTIWFALLHELSHVLFDYETIKSGGFHISLDTKAEDIFLNEKTEEFANAFARDYFLNESQLKYVSPFINNETMINRYAQQNNIHPSIIYAFYCYGKPSKVYSFYQKYIPQTRKTFHNVNVCLLDYDTISDAKPVIESILESQNI